MLPDPDGEGSLFGLARGHFEHHAHAVGVARRARVAIEREEQLGGDERGSLAAVDEGLIARQAEAHGLDPAIMRSKAWHNGHEPSSVSDSFLASWQLVRPR